MPNRQDQEAGEDIFYNGIGIGTGGMGKGNAPSIQGIPIYMVCSYRGRADELYPAAFKQGVVDRGHASHEKHIHLFQVCGSHGPTSFTGNPTPFREGFFDERNILVGQNVHGDQIQQGWKTPETNPVSIRF